MNHELNAHTNCDDQMKNDYWGQIFSSDVALRGVSKTKRLKCFVICTNM